jgi:homoprotocatechuate degradation regulator HpaR
MKNQRAPETDRSLPIALLRARERVMGPIRAMLADVGVTEQQWRVLRVLDERGPLDPTEIADHSCLLLPSLTRILQTLEGKHLVSRAPHPTDRRKQVVTITDDGRALIAENLQESQRLNAWLRDSFGAEKLDTLLDLLNELDRLDRLDRPGGR